MLFEYTFRGDIRWHRAEDTPIDHLHIYVNDCSIGKPFEIACVDDQFCNDSQTASPAQLFAHSISTSHMFAFLELCGENSLPIQAYADDPIVYVYQGDEWILEKVI